MLMVLAALIVMPLFIPQHATIPVQGATRNDWNKDAFWYQPWGKSGVHKGIDIFAPQGRPVFASVHGVVVFQGQLGMGGNVIAVLGPKWRIHYFAHLHSTSVTPMDWVTRGQIIGSVGSTGNAAGKPPHLHYAVLSLLPMPWRATTQTQGWKRMFFVDPGLVIVEPK